MEMPKPDENHAKLHVMVGEWEGEEKTYPSPWAPEGSESIGRISAKMDLNGFFLITNYEQLLNSAVSFRGHGVYGYDMHAKKFTMHWFDTMGGDPGAPATGDWDGSTICFLNQHHYGHGRYTYDFLEDGAYTFKMEMSQDGTDWAPLMESTYRRKK